MKKAEYSDLPSELIDGIFDTLWNISSKRTLLRNCLPVSTDFRHRIMSRFCSYVDLSDHDEERVARLRELITRSPDSRLGGIGRYIKHFSLILRQDWYAPVSGILLQVVDDSHLVAILEGLRGDDFGVTELSLTVPAECLASDSALWIDLPTSLRSAFQSLLHSPYLTRLNLTNLAVPESIFIGSFLQDLSIQKATNPRLDELPLDIQELDFAPVSVSPLPSLVSLRTDYSHEIYSTHLPEPMLDKLKIFTELPNRFLSSQRTWHMLGVSASSLTEISIDHTGEVVNPPEYFNLGSVHNLKVFKYSRRSCDRDPFRFSASNDSTPSILCHLFHVNEPMQNLESVKIEFNLAENVINNSFLDEIRARHGWASLDADLSNASLFPCLTQFGIHIATTTIYYVRPLVRHNFMKETNRVLGLSFPHVLATETISFRPTANILKDRDNYIDPIQDYYP